MRRMFAVALGAALLVTAQVNAQDTTRVNPRREGRGDFGARGRFGLYAFSGDYRPWQLSINHRAQDHTQAGKSEGAMSAWRIFRSEYQPC